MTLPRILVALLSLLPAPVRRRLILAILRRFLYRAPARGRSAGRFRPSLARHELEQRVRHARAFLHGLALAAGDLAHLCRELAQDAARALAQRTLRRTLHLKDRFVTALPKLARTRVPSRAEPTGWTNEWVQIDANEHPHATHARHASLPREGWSSWRGRLRAYTAVEDWLVWDAPPPPSIGAGAGVASTHVAAA